MVERFVRLPSRNQLYSFHETTLTSFNNLIVLLQFDLVGFLTARPRQLENLA